MKAFQSNTLAVALVTTLCSTAAWADNNIQLNYNKYSKMPITIYADQQNVIHFNNTSKTPVTLNGAQIQFYYNGSIDSLNLDTATFKLIKHIASPKAPNSMGDFYTYQIESDKLLVLQPGQQLTVAVKGKSLLDQSVHGLKVLAATLVPVQAQITASTVNGNTTISICNNSKANIPLTNLELDFTYAGNITSIWGTPWLNWQATSNKGQYILTGGNPYATAPYAPDANCKTPITVVFNATQGAADPTNFVLKAAGGTPIGLGTLEIQMDNAPQTGINNPIVSVSGVGFAKEQTVKWGSKWDIPSLVPGTYTIKASSVDNGVSYYQAVVTPNSATVVQNKTTEVDINYKAVPTGIVTVTFNNAPAASEPVSFFGTQGSYLKTVQNNSKVTLPQDTYVVSSQVPGYAAMTSPSSITLGQSAAVNITYNQIAEKNYVGYFESWDDNWADTPQQTQLAQVPTYVNYVMLSFMQPDAQYTPGSYDFTNTGLQFGYDGQMLKAAIAQLKKNNPNVKIIASVGGATYPNWSKLNTTAIANFVKDFGLDGVDVDFEIDPGCSVGADNLIHCTVDNEYSQVVSALRKALPRPYLLTVAGWSTGAYGEDQWVNAPPMGSHTGEVLPLLRTNNQDIDMMMVMSYDAGTSFDPEQALDAFQYYYKGPIAMGVEVPPEAWGGHVYTLPAVADLTNAVLKKSSETGNAPGMMIWALQINATGTPGPNNPSAQMISQQICQQMGLGNCDQAWNL